MAVTAAGIYIGQPGSCFTPSGTAHHRGSVNTAGKPGSCSTKKEVEHQILALITAALHQLYIH